MEELGLLFGAVWGVAACSAGMLVGGDSVGMARMAALIARDRSLRLLIR